MDVSFIMLEGSASGIEIRRYSENQSQSVSRHQVATSGTARNGETSSRQTYMAVQVGN